ncbi:hypothetical protein PDTK01_38320, partial [Phycicoccus sp. DTK01]
MVPRRS